MELLWGAGPVPGLELELVEGAGPSPEPLLDSGGVGSALGAGPVAEKMKDSLKRYKYDRDYWYVYSLTVTFCDINTSREQSFSVTHEAKYEMRTCRRSHEEIFIDVHINKLPLYGKNQALYSNKCMRMYMLVCSNV